MKLQVDTVLTANRAALMTMAGTIAQLPADSGVEDQVPTDGVVPAELVRYLARLRLLEGVPFSYLVPDAELIPPETIRFFYLDRNATDALVEGALSVGTVNAADRIELAQLYARVRDEVDTAERLVRMKDSDAPVVDAAGRPIGAGGPISGFVLRSRLVSGWPGLHVRAYSVDDHPDDATGPEMDDSPDRVRLLRMERLAPAVLLVLFDGVPAVVHIEEPRSGIQFGTRLASDAPGDQQTAVIPLRDVTNPNAGPLLQGDGTDETVTVPFRPGSPGVIDLRTLNQRMLAAPGTNMNGSIDPAEWALQMLRFPFRQVFGDTHHAPNDPDPDPFVVTIKLTELVQRFSLAAEVLR